jgi:hypothetical protein
MDPLIASSVMNEGATVEPKRPKVPKEIQKLIKAFDNRRQHYFLIYIQDGELITTTNIKTNNGSEILQQSIKHHYENV